MTDEFEYFRTILYYLHDAVFKLSPHVLLTEVQVLYVLSQIKDAKVCLFKRIQKRDIYLYLYIKKIG